MNWAEISKRLGNPKKPNPIAQAADKCLYLSGKATVGFFATMSGLVLFILAFVALFFVCMTIIMTVSYTYYYIRYEPSFFLRMPTGLIMILVMAPFGLRFLYYIVKGR